MSNPAVFISYSHDSEEHKAWVLKLATDLRSHGVDAILDQWDLRIGSDLRFFMERGLTAANLVLCICSEAYVDKVDTGSGGSGYEGMIMTRSLLQNAKTEFIVPVVRNNSSSKKVPVALTSKLYIDFTDDKQYIARYQELLARIYGEDSKKKPPLGSNPFSVTMSEMIELKNKIESVRYCSAAMDGSVVFRFDNNNGLYTLGSGEYTFSTRWSG
ncbi:MAG: toll/interleukin-1 receptor domain-containing protein [Eggerthellaceae bacterium]|nr:toll/interleukin-1 receptor domain-containing protein [Eggerthellaceae bacterium]